MGRPLPVLLLLAQTCIPVSWGLRCMLCKTTGSCRVEECAPGQDLCRTTVLRIWEEGDELEVVERGCTHPEKTNRTMSYRTGMQIVSLTEAVCGSDLCNKPSPGQVSNIPRSRYLECASCASSDLSCEMGRDKTLQCRNPGEQCLDVVTHQSLEESPRDERHSRGCGNLPGCPGPTGFHNNHTFHFLRCCNTTKCNGGPGLGNPSYTIRGCATPSWCQRLPVAEAFSLTHLNVSCCTGNGCNHPDLVTQPHTGGAPLPGPAHLSLFVTLLITARLWGGTFLCT
ncbi:urokinase plasminogen activator surface receptor isoform X4 [Lagenorhynchus albirostris]|uniref:urokinase plasminogen activator surface receptor isoform X4 n=1 Tax=Lagenorhynchus albirostris TaxID=27610 RepID=UPI0028E9B1B2|nr:urokinase plasminogen activator surface receptor isoform X4 [Lagenorhynchus albirostris]